MRHSPAAVVVLAALLALVACGSGGPAAAAAGGEAGALDPGAREPRAPDWGGLLDDRADWREVPLGEGRFGPPRSLPDLGTDWLRELIVPLHDAPDPGRPWGRLERGWLVPAAGAPEPLPGDCLVETGYATASLLVLESRADGWLRVPLLPPCDRGGLWLRPEEALWTPPSPSDETLVAQSWAELFTGPDMPPLHLRTAETAALRAGPAEDAALLATVDRAAAFRPLEVAGDWMRVVAVQPSDHCLAPEEWQGRRIEGWLRWRDPDLGPRLWYPPRGC